MTLTLSYVICYVLVFLGIIPTTHSWTSVDQTRRHMSLGVGGLATLAIGWRAGQERATAEDLAIFQDGPRGIKYKILKEGEGLSPVRGQQVNTKYTLWVGGFGEDGGKQLDSNTGFLGRPLPVIVGIGRVIKGWDLTLLDMKVGEIRRIVVPYELGYGEKGAGGSIPPKANLYFEVEITEMDSLKELTAQQKQWLVDNPL